MDQIVVHLTQQREKLREPVQSEDSGRISAVADMALISLYNRLINRMDIDPQQLRRQAAIVGTAEYGRRQLGPFSPLSVLIVQAPEATLDTETWLAGIIEPLREAGWSITHDIATTAEIVERSLSELYWLGAAIDSRFITGCRTFADELLVSLGREIRSRGERPSSIRAFFNEWKERHHGQRNPALLLEPDLDYSAGSLGELCRMRWAGFLIYDTNTLAELPWLTSDKIDALREAEAFLLRVRNHLQLLRGGQETRLQYESQQETAFSLGYKDQDDFLAVERMMKDVESHFYNVRLIADRLRDLLAEWVQSTEPERPPARGIRELAPGIMEKADLVEVEADRLSGPPAGILMEIFRQAVNEKLPQGLEAYRWAARHAQELPAALEGQAGLREWLFAIFQKETPQARTMRALYDTGVLSALIPELRSVHALVQHDAFHVYPVHEHHLETFAEMKKLLNGEYDEAHPEVKEWIEGRNNEEVLMLAALIHDVGKSGGHGHAERGGEMAWTIGKRLGLTEEQTELLGFLVTNHVLLTDSAARRDLADQEMLQYCAEVIGSGERLKMLMLHSFADMKATGPRAWEYWQNLPMQSLYRQLLHRLEKGEPAERAVASRLQFLRGRVAELSGDEMDAEELDSHFNLLPPRYLLSVTPEEMVGHLRLERQLDEKKICWQVQEKKGRWELTLVSRQPHALLARMAGILTLHELDIRKAQTHTKKNGVALQTFEVVPMEPQVDISWQRLMSDLEKTLEGKLALDYRLARHAAEKERKRRPIPERPDEVILDNESSYQDTIIEVYTTDRLGLLYAITRTLLDLQLEVYLAKISTRADQVADIFYVRTRAGQRVEDPEQIEEIKQALLFSLQPA